jgi:solute carrier family 35
MMNLTSKALIANYFTSPCLFLLIVQHTMIAFYGYYKKYKVNWDEFRECFYISIFSLGNVAFGSIGMHYVNLPMYVALRKLCTAEIFVIDVYVFKQPYKWTCAAGVLGISVGTLVAGFNDLTSDTYGYAIVFVANLMNALLLISVRHSNTKVPTLRSFKQVYICSIISIPCTVILCYTFEEHISLGSSLYSHTPSFLGIMAYAGLLGVFCNYMLFKCASEVSPIATSVTGNAKDLASMSIGLFAFSDVKPNFLFLTGLFISVLGALVYTLGSLRYNKKLSY